MSLNENEIINCKNNIKLLDDEIITLVNICENYRMLFESDLNFDTFSKSTGCGEKIKKDIFDKIKYIEENVKIITEISKEADNVLK